MALQSVATCEFGSLSPHAIVNHIRDTSKINVWCAVVWINAQPYCWPVPFRRRNRNCASLSRHASVVCGTTTGGTAAASLATGRCPTALELAVWEFINETFPGRWIGRDGQYRGLHDHLT